MFKKYSELGIAALPEDKYKTMMRAVSGMESNYATAKICSYKNASKCDLSLEPGKWTAAYEGFNRFLRFWYHNLVTGEIEPCT